MELNSKIDSLKSFLSEVRDIDERCKNFKASKIVIVNSKLRSVRDLEAKSIDSAIHYPERATGNFDINTDDEDLRAIFERRDLKGGSFFLRKLAKGRIKIG